jgi:hypothetical protein
MKQFELGKTVRDRITTVEGIAMARIEYLNGYVRYDVQPVGLKDGKPFDSIWVDAHQLELVDKETPEVTTSGTGGPSDTPPPMSTP